MRLASKILGLALFDQERHFREWDLNEGACLPLEPLR